LVKIKSYIDKICESKLLRDDNTELKTFLQELSKKDIRYCKISAKSSENMRDLYRILSHVNQTFIEEIYHHDKQMLPFVAEEDKEIDRGCGSIFSCGVFNN
jgi:hypothetical protein